VTLLLAAVDETNSAGALDRVGHASPMVRYPEILEDAITVSGGVPTDPVGHRIGGAFVKGSDAAAAAVASQRAFRVELGASRLIRMAIHAGEVSAGRGADPAVTTSTGRLILRAARLCSCAHGGQILVSGAAADLMADALPAGASLEHLGSHRVRDLARRERVAQLTHPELESDFAPLRTLDKMPHSLPAPLTSLIGRDADVVQIGAQVRRNRLVTLTGAGGVGKTRLAQQVAADLVDDHADGTWWVGLAPATGPAAVLSTIAAGIGLVLHPRVAPAEQILAHLGAAGDILVALDNCEHVIELVAPLVAQVLDACPSLSILATSRERLGVVGEQVWRVASLTAPAVGQTVTAERLETFDAATLFIERARRARPALAVDDRSAAHIAAICGRLDGIPLAIELAAAGVRNLTLDRLASGLDHAFTLFTGGDRNRVPRQQTLQASIQWSHDLLSPTVRAVLRRLSICPTAFDLDAAEAIAADEHVVARSEAVEAVARLVDKNLAEFEVKTGRYRMLETIRQFGLDRLRDVGEESATRRRHADHWAVRALAIGTWGPDLDLAALRDALPDILLMLEWAVVDDPDLADRVLGAITNTAYSLGRWLDLHRACDWMVADRPRGPHWAHAVGAVATHATWIGRTDVSELTAAAMERAILAGDNTAVHYLRVGVALPAWGRGDLSLVRALAADAFVAGDDYPALMAAAAVIVTAAVYGQVDELAAMSALVERICAKAGQAVDYTAAGPGACIALQLAGELDAAVDRLPSAPIPIPMIARYWAATQARLALMRHDPDLAHGAAALAPGDSGLVASEAYFHHIVDWAAAVIDHDVDGAVAAIGAAVDHVVGFPTVEVLCEQAATLLTFGAASAAEAIAMRLDDCLAAVTEPAPLPRAQAHLLHARLALGHGDLAAAEAAAHDALRVAAGAGLRLVQIDALEAVAAVHDASHQPTRAARLLGAASGERRRTGYRARIYTAVPASLVNYVASEDPQGWDQGTRLTHHDAVALAQRTRGPRGRPSFGLPALTPTENLVVDRVVGGSTNAEIAADLCITIRTVKTHLTRIFAKLGVRNRSELAVLATRHRPP
jgi:predicted ATPase/DNA-binding CsgD family transcriptional regulator